MNYENKYRKKSKVFSEKTYLNIGLDPEYPEPHNNVS